MRIQITQAELDHLRASYHFPQDNGYADHRAPVVALLRAKGFVIEDNDPMASTPVERRYSFTVHPYQFVVPVRDRVPRVRRQRYV